MNFLALPEISPLLSSTGGHDRHAAHPCGTNSTRALVATALPGSDRAEQSKPRSSTGSHSYLPWRLGTAPPCRPVGARRDSSPTLASFLRRSLRRRAQL